MVLIKQALLPVAIAQIASFGLITWRTNARWGCAHMSICKVSMEMQFSCLSGPRDADSPAGIWYLSLEVSPVESKALRDALDSGFYVLIWRVIRGIGLSISLAIFTVFWSPTPKQQPDILLLQSPKIKMNKLSQVYQGTLSVFSRIIF